MNLTITRRLTVLALAIGALAVTAGVANAATGVPTYSAAARTGNAKVDPFLVAMQRHDVAAIVDRVHYTKLPCVKKRPPGYDDIMCKPGEPAGTLVDTFWLGSCDAGSVRADDIDITQTVSSFVNSDRKLYAVYRSDGHSITPKDGFGIIFAQPVPGDTYASTLVLNKKGGLTGIAFAHCADGPGEVWKYSKGPVILPPKKR